jgi:hypothetical protein
MSAIATTPAVERLHPPPRWLVNNIANPVIRRVLRRANGKMSRELLLLRFRGRKTGRPYEVPVSYRDFDGRMVVLSTSGWRKNFQNGAEVEVVLHGTVRKARATLLDHPSMVAEIYERMIDQFGMRHAKRWLGIKINVDRKPTRDELTEMARRSGLGVIWIDL